MRKYVNRIIIGVVVFLLAGCVTIKDVQRSTDLIRTDNELTRLLVEVRPGDKAGAAAYLVGLAIDAKKEADALKGVQENEVDAIAFYRIASTAYWKSGKPEVVNDLFETASNGTDLCVKLGENAPDRDCLFLRLVIPFAGLESIAEKYLSGSLDTVNFNDGTATADEKDKMREIHGWLKLAKSPTKKILAIGEDDRLLSHQSMQDYYCDNAKKAINYYNPTASVFATKVKEYLDNFGDPKPDIGVNVEEARGLKLNETAAGEKVSDFCFKE